MKIKFLRACKDKNTGEEYNAGLVKEFEDKRALEIIATKYAREVKEPVHVDVEAHMEEMVAAQEETAEVASVADEEPVEETPATEPVKLSDLTVKELKELAKEAGVAVRGTKEEIIERLLASQEE